MRLKLFLSLRKIAIFSDFNNYLLLFYRLLRIKLYKQNNRSSTLTQQRNAVPLAAPCQKLHN